MVKLYRLASLFLAIVEVHSRSPKHLGPASYERLRLDTPRVRRQELGTEEELPFGFPKGYGAPGKLVPQNENTTKFAVDGTKIPDVNFDVGESYAGLLPIGNENRNLYFWYFPTPNPDGKNDITIWLNGGPGCSSLEGFLQENGPFLWNYGTFKPVRNPWSWIHLTNMLWVDQPAGTGFSQSLPTERSNKDVAKSFAKWFKNFVDTFGLQGKKIYIAGESYAGLYVPYIADAMFQMNDTSYYNVHGTMIYDGMINTDKVMAEIPAIAYVKEFSNIFRFNQSTMAKLETLDKTCGHTDFLNKWMTYPPKGKMPTPSGGSLSCNRLWRYLRGVAMENNPCFNQYQITTTCPLLWDVLGFPGSFEYLPDGAQIYFDRDDVKKAVNAPAGTTWSECSNIPLANTDRSQPASYSVLPSVIDKSKRTIISHGTLDFILMTNGSLLTIQNMTWGGKQGFQTRPRTPFVVPYHDSASLSTVSGSGTQGIVHTERGLTWVEVFLSGHMVPQYTPSVAFRQLEFLLGRVPSLTDAKPFTFPRNNTFVQAFDGFDGKGLDR